MERPHVFSNRVVLGESLVTLGACEDPVDSMRKHMVLHNRHLVETLLTEGTFIIFLVRVRLQVTRQGRVVHEPFQTNVTLQRLGVFLPVTQHVPGEALLTTECLPALVTFVRFVRVHHTGAFLRFPVFTSMLYECNFVVELLPTHWAFKYGLLMTRDNVVRALCRQRVNAQLLERHVLFAITNKFAYFLKPCKIQNHLLNRTFQDNNCDYRNNHLPLILQL